MRRTALAATTALALAVLLLLTAGCGGDSPSSDAADTTSSTPSTTEATEGEGESGEHFTADNWALLDGSPDDYKGSTVDVIGEIFLAPERDAEGVYFQMYADPNADEYNTVVAHRDTTLTVKNGDYVHITGEVADVTKGTNAFGADLELPTVIADTVEVVDATAAAPPATETFGKATFKHGGIALTVDKVEFADTETRVFLTVDNSSNADFTFYSSSTKALQGRKQVEPEYSSDYPEVPSDITAGALVSGVIVYPPMDPSLGLVLLMEGSSEDSNVGEYGSLEWRFNWK